VSYGGIFTGSPGWPSHNYDQFSPIGGLTGDGDAKCILEEHEFAQVPGIGMDELCERNSLGKGEWFVCDAAHHGEHYFEESDSTYVCSGWFGGGNWEQIN
jgi:hypothetical protein